MKSLLELIDAYEQDLWHSELVVSRGQLLLRAGEKEKYIYYIVAGALVINLETEDTSHCIRFGYRGSFITALDSYIHGRGSLYSIQAIRKSTVKRIKIEDYHRFLHSSEERRAYQDFATNSIVMQQLEREVDLLISAPKMRFERVWKRSPQLFQEIPSRYIASYLRMSPETLSRLNPH